MADSDGHSSGSSPKEPDPGGSSHESGSTSFGSGASWFRDTGPSPAAAPPPAASTSAAAPPRARTSSAPRARTSSGSGAAPPELVRAIKRRPRVSLTLGMLLALVFALLVTPSITAERWLASLGVGPVKLDRPAVVSVRVAPFAGSVTREGRVGGGVYGGGVVIARGATPTAAQHDDANAVIAALPRGPLPYVALFGLVLVLAAVFSHHMRRSTKGRLVRVQIVSLVSIAVLAAAIKLAMLTTALSILVVPVALLAMVPTMVLDRIVGIATGVLAALVTSLLIPFDVGIAILLLVQAAVAGLVVAEHPRHRWRAAMFAGGVTTVLTAATYVLLTYLTTGVLPSLADPLHSPWLAAAIGPAIATLLAVPLVPLYQLLVGEITLGKLIELENLSQPLLRQIAERAPGTWQHSLTMANLADIAANAVGASGRLVRVGAYYHDLGKSLQPKYFIENLEPGETSPHDQLPPEASCDAIFAHVVEGLVVARKAGLHERIVDFMHMHHGNGVLEYFWGKTKEQGNPRGFSIDRFRYPGHPPQSRETAILAICDAVEAASRTLKKPDPASIDQLVQRIVYGKLHLGQLDESGLSMSDLRRVSDALRETIRHANHKRIEYPWQKPEDESPARPDSTVQPRLDSLDRKPRRDTAIKGVPRLEIIEDAAASREQVFAATRESSGRISRSGPEALAETADLTEDAAGDVSILDTAPAPQLRTDGLARDPRAGRPSYPDDDGRATELGHKRPAEIVREIVPPADARATELGLGRPVEVRSPAAARPADAPAGRSAGIFPAATEAAAADAPASRSGGVARAATDAPPSGGRPGIFPAATNVPPGRSGGVARATTDARSAASAEPGRLDEVAPRARTAETERPRLMEPSASPPERSGSTRVGRAEPEPLPGPPPELFPSVTIEPAHRRAPPAAMRRAPSTPPPDAEQLRPPTIPPAAIPTRHGGPPPPADLESMVTHPPPMRRTPSAPGAAIRLPALIVDEHTSPRLAALPEAARRRTDDDESPDLASATDEVRITGDAMPYEPDDGLVSLGEMRTTLERPAAVPPREIRTTLERPVAIPPREPHARSAAAPATAHQRPAAAAPSGEIGERRGLFHIEDAGRTEPSMPRFELPAPQAPPTPTPTPSDIATTLPAKPKKHAWSSGLAARVDQALDGDEWSTETPVRPPSKAELRSLLGVPDPTRETPIDELEALHRAADAYRTDPSMLAEPPPPRRAIPQTAEVDPDDIEAAIELAPPARRSPNTVAAKPKKPE